MESQSGGRDGLSRARRPLCQSDRRGGFLRRRRGSLFILTLITVSFSAALSGQMLTSSIVEQWASVRSLNGAKAFHLSEAGLAFATRQLQGNLGYGGSPYTALGSGLGGYQVVVIPDGPSQRIIRSTGFYPSNDPTAFGYTTRMLESVVQFSRGTGPGYGLLGDRRLRFNGGGRFPIQVDSYDSREGPYDSEQTRSNVRIGTNSHEDEALSLIGQVTINGDVVLGPGSDPERTLWRVPQQWTSISGSIRIAESEIPLEPVEIPALPDRGDLSIGGNEVITLEGGLYRFRAIRISGNGRLVFTGPAEVYVEEDVDLAGDGIGTAGERPPNLILYVKGSSVSIKGNAALYARISAPEATVQISGNGAIYGAIAGREILVHGNGGVHYDEALNLYDEALNPADENDLLRATILSWREENSSQSH